MPGTGREGSVVFQNLFSDLTAKAEVLDLGGSKIVHYLQRHVDNWTCPLTFLGTVNIYRQ